MAVFAINAATGALPPLRNRLTVSSSHIVCTEPVPDVLDALGWRGGESISDGRALLHYLRTTRDDRIVFGWAGGRMAAGVRTRGRMDVDPGVIAQVQRDLVRFFPALEGRRLTHAWGGPIDVSPTHRPAIVGLQGLPAWAAFGYTGNGVAPSHLFGRALAALALDRRDAVTRLPFVDPPPKAVPPEPLRIAGAAVLRRALARKEAAEEAGRTPDPVTAGARRAARPDRPAHRALINDADQPICTERPTSGRALAASLGSSMDVLIAGGHGQVARRLIRLLASDGHTARGLIRNPDHAADLEADGGVPVVCDLEREDPAPHARGADAIVFAAGAGPGSGR